MDTTTKPPRAAAPSRARRWAERLKSRALDRSVLFSFDQSGYRRHARDFDPADLAVDMDGKICLITGANAGLGYATARALASRSATVYLLCRDRQRGQRARDQLAAETGNQDVHLAVVDVSEQASIGDFVRQFAPARVDVLIHNAGVLPDFRQLTDDDAELTWATHVLGPFALTEQLAPKLRAADRARVIWVSSGGMYTQKLDLSDLDWQARAFDGVIAYAHSMRAQVILGELWADALRADGVIVHSMHPGWADTGAVKTSLPRFHRLMRGRLRSPEEGADTLVWLAVNTAAGRESGRFWFDREAQPTHLLPHTRERESERQALWALCAERCRGATAAG